MLARCIHSDFTNAPKDILESGYHVETNTGLEVGRKYYVYGIACSKYPAPGFRRLSYFMVMGDGKYPYWMPTWLFEVIDSGMPKDWGCNMFDGEFLVIGPQFMIESEITFNALSDCEPEMISKFKTHYDLT